MAGKKLMSSNSTSSGPQPRMKKITRRELNREILIKSIGFGALLGAGSGSCGICVECYGHTHTVQSGCSKREEIRFEVDGRWSKTIGVAGYDRIGVLLAWVWGGIVGGGIGAVAAGIGAAHLSKKEIEEFVPVVVDSPFIIRGIGDPRRRWIVHPKEIPIIATGYDEQKNQINAYLANGSIMNIDSITGIHEINGTHTFTPPPFQPSNTLAIGDWQWVTSGGSLTAFEKKQERWHLNLHADVVDVPIIDVRAVQKEVYSSPPINSVEVFHLGTFLSIIRNDDPTAFFHDPYTGKEIETYKRPEHVNTTPCRIMHTHSNAITLPFEDGYLAFFRWDKGTNPRLLQEFEMESNWKGLWLAGCADEYYFIASPHSVVAFKRK